MGLGLLVLGAALAISFDRLSASNNPKPTSTPAASASFDISPSASALDSASASAAESPSPSPSGPAAELAALMPGSVNGTALTTETALDTSSLGNTPSTRALGAAVTSLGKKPADFELAYAYDPSGAMTMTILAFRLPGVDPAKLKAVVLTAWLSSGTPGVTTANVNLSGTPVTRVSYGTGPNEYVLVHKDGVFIVEEADATLAGKAAAAIVAGPSASPAASGSPAPSGSVAPSSSTAPSASGASPSPS